MCSNPHPGRSPSRKAATAKLAGILSPRSTRSKENCDFKGWRLAVNRQPVHSIRDRPLCVVDDDNPDSTLTFHELQPELLLERREYVWQVAKPCSRSRAAPDARKSPQ